MRKIWIFFSVVVRKAMSWHPDFSANGKPFYLAIADALADDVRLGVAQPGEKLPTQRPKVKTVAPSEKKKLPESTTVPEPSDPAGKVPKVP